jgi:hypothetical protein
MFRSYFDKFNRDLAPATPQRSLWSIAAKKRSDSKPTSKIQDHSQKIAEECAPIFDLLAQTYTCVVCDTKYTGFSNIGSWRCRTHTGDLNSREIWDCCGKERFAEGCTRADHISQRQRLRDQDRHLEIPLWIIDRFNVPAERMTVVKHEDPRLMKVIVRRVEI